MTTPEELTFDELRDHVGHEVTVSEYGVTPAYCTSVVLECLTCGKELLSFDNPIGIRQAFSRGYDARRNGQVVQNPWTYEDSLLRKAFEFGVRAAEHDFPDQVQRFPQTKETPDVG